ncbi:MAG: DUF2309 domain-containing protein [Bacteroidia bacterium]|nr:DUF2309 domain-containing protein [Bacteroidia bacterium]
METSNALFNEHKVLHELKHFLPAQSPLKDFIHHNTLHVFQDKKFYTALQYASDVFGYKTTLSLKDYRKLFQNDKISKAVLEKIITDRKGHEAKSVWLDKVLNEEYGYSVNARIGKMRANWKSAYKIDLDNLVHPELFRLICSYLDQGISIWNFPVQHMGFFASLCELERLSFVSLFKTSRARKLLLKGNVTIKELLDILVGDETLYERYLFDQQFAHHGWSGMVSVIEDQPQTLLDRKKISLHDFILFELLLEIDALDKELGIKWPPLCERINEIPAYLFDPVQPTELSDVISIWQDAYEWSFYDQVLAGIKLQKPEPKIKKASFQAMFCIDDRQCSLRRYIENFDSQCETFGTPGFFGVEFYYQPKNGKFYTKLCPAPVTPKYLIREINTKGTREKDLHFNKRSHSLFSGWLITQSLGFWSAFKLMLNIFKPAMGPATTSSFKHMDQFSKLTIENKNINQISHNLQVGFTIDEMVVRVEGLLKSIGLVKDFAPIVYVIGHGASSVNNTHYAGYDCGACSGRPGSVNAKVMSFMANHPAVRELLKERGLNIPADVQFLGGLHDTTNDEISFYEEDSLSEKNAALHQQNKKSFINALDENAKERSRRFILINSHQSAEKVHKQVKLRSVSLFEPRPELNHATVALCIVGRRAFTKNLFLDRRAFMNSYDYSIDPEGKILFNILKPIGPVCGGINLEYYFSRVDNQKLGAGTKLPHNVMGLIGVANGIDGDLRPGLPSQMIEVHDPIRLLLIVEHFPDVLLKTIQQLPEVYEWYINEWIHLVAVNPNTRELYEFKDGAFFPYQPIQQQVNEINDLNSIIESTEENLPVYMLKH